MFGIAMIILLLYLLIGFAITLLLFYFKPDWFDENSNKYDTIFNVFGKMSAVIIIFLWPIVLIGIPIYFLIKGFEILFDYIIDLGENRREFDINPQLAKQEFEQKCYITNDQYVIGYHDGFYDAIAAIKDKVEGEEQDVC